MTQTQPATTTANKIIGKNRNPLTVIILSIVTFGIYSIVWYYSIFEELKNYRGQGWSGPFYIILALFFGIALIACPWLIPAYVGRMYEEDGQDKPISGLTGFWIFVPIAGGIVWIYKVQGHMNNFWDAKR